MQPAFICPVKEEKYFSAPANSSEAANRFPLAI